MVDRRGKAGNRSGPAPHALRTTEAARLYRITLVVASAALAVSPYLRWFSIYGAVYSLWVADRVPVVPVMVTLLGVAGVAGGLWRPSRSKDVGRWVGALSLAANVLGFVVAAVADPLVASTPPLYRIYEQISAWVTWGGCVAFGASAIILLGALSAWRPAVPLMPAPAADASPCPMRPSRRGEGGELMPALPAFDSIIAPVEEAGTRSVAGQRAARHPR